MGKLLRPLVVFFIVVSFVAQATAADFDCPASAQKFWKQFRQLALKDKTVDLAKVTRFPFQLYGTLDSSDRREVDKTVFLSSFALIIQSDPGMSAQTSTMRALVQKTVTLPKASCGAQGDQFRVGNWVFQLSKAGWLFTRAYIED